MFYFLISTVFFIVGIFVIYWVHNQYHLDIRVDPKDAAAKAPLISVCVPARNEERNIGACVEALFAQTYPNLEIIIVNDHSMDATPSILERYARQDDRLRVVTGADLPQGWAGKPHALYQAATVAHGEWLCFVDADTFLEPEAITSCYAKASETCADLFTILTFQITGTFWEKTVLPLVMTALSTGFSPRRVNDPKRKDAIANGQFILVKRSVYDAIGGHERIKNQIVEDKAISEQVKWNGYRLIIADGMNVARTRMYTSLPEIWEGWTKNIYLGLREQLTLLWLGVFGAVLSVVTAVFLPFWPVLGWFWYLHGGGTAALAVIVEAIMLWGILIYVRARVAQNMRISRWYALTTPLGAAIFAAMMLTSAWKVLSGKGVTWRGRTYNP